MWWKTPWTGVYTWLFVLSLSPTNHQLHFNKHLLKTHCVSGSLLGVGFSESPSLLSRSSQTKTSKEDMVRRFSLRRRSVSSGRPRSCPGASTAHTMWPEGWGREELGFVRRGLASYVVWSWKWSTSELKTPWERPLGTLGSLRFYVSRTLVHVPDYPFSIGRDMSPYMGRQMT